MSGTSASYVASSGGVMLPAPKVQAYHPVAPADLFVADRSASSGAIVQVKAPRYIKVTAPGIPSAVLDDIDTYKPQVELLRFTRLNSREGASAGNGTKTSAYVHPSNGPGASGDGSYTHGGVHGGTDPLIAALRVTEWPILNSDDWFDVSQAMLGFMCYGQVSYREPGGTYTTDKMVYPSWAYSSSVSLPGRRFPYSRLFTPGYYAFRLSVTDPNDARGKRIHGPNSVIVSCTNHVFPFTPSGLDPAGKATAKIAAGFDGTVVNFWLGSTSRLPAT